MARVTEVHIKAEGRQLSFTFTQPRKGGRKKLGGVTVDRSDMVEAVATITDELDRIKSLPGS